MKGGEVAGVEGVRIDVVEDIGIEFPGVPAEVEDVETKVHDLVDDVDDVRTGMESEEGAGVNACEEFNLEWRVKRWSD